VAGEDQTNNAAKLLGIAEQLERWPSSLDSSIFTGSNYALMVIDKAKEWRDNQSNKAPNATLIRKILQLLEERNAAGSKTLFNHVYSHLIDNPAKEENEQITQRRQEMEEKI
jgi:ribonuclease HI